jgi:hypothetical protein
MRFACALLSLSCVFACAERDGDAGGECLDPVVLAPVIGVGDEVSGLSAGVNEDIYLQGYTENYPEGRTALIFHWQWETESFTFEITIPYAHKPALFSVWEYITIIWYETDPGATFELYDDDGLIIGAVTDTRSDVTINGVHMTVDTDCAEIGEDGSPLQPTAGYVTASLGGEQVRVEVGEPVTVDIDGHAYDIWVTTATSNPCCEGDLMSAAIIRRPSP